MDARLKRFRDPAAPQAFRADPHASHGPVEQDFDPLEIREETPSVFPGRSASDPTLFLRHPAA